jgi:Leucine-rich repeat (LRR) protein
MTRLENNKEHYLELINKSSINIKDNIIDFFEDYELNKSNVKINVSTIAYINQETRYLELTDNNLEYLPDIINTCKKLEVLDLSKNKIKDFRFLKSLKNLKILFIDYCSLDDFPKEICELENLIALNINNNNIKEIPPEVKSISNLTTINVGSNILTIIPSELTSNDNLIALYAYNNPGITFTTDNSPLLNNLLELDINGCETEFIPTILFNTKQLIYLDLGNNKIRTVPEGFLNLSCLQKLDLTDNCLNLDPSSLVNIQSDRLYFLDISDNSIDALNIDFASNKNLEKLHLNSNKIKEIPTSINLLNNLDQLYLANNELTKLPNSMCELESLLDLDLSVNKIEYLPDDIGKLKNLRRLSLDNNSLLNLPRTIGNLLELRYLHLGNYNFIIKDDRSKNKLTLLPPEIGNLSKLTHLSIENNLLLDLPDEFADLLGLNSLILENNPFLNAPEIKEKGIGELFDLLNKRRGISQMDLHWEVPRPLQTAFQRYFDNFTSYFKKVFGEDIEFEVLKERSGLIFRFHSTPTISLQEISDQLVQYIDLLEQDKDNISIEFEGRELSQIEFDLLIADLKEERRSLEAKINIAKLEAKHAGFDLLSLESHPLVKSLQAQVQTLSTSLNKQQDIALEQARSNNLLKIGNSTSPQTININNSNSTQNLNQISITQFQESASDALGEVKNLILDLADKEDSESQEAIKELENLKRLLNEASEAKNKLEVKKTGLLGYLKKFVNETAKVYKVVTDSELTSSLKTILDAVSKNIDKLETMV